MDSVTQYFGVESQTRVKLYLTFDGKIVEEGKPIQYRGDVS